MKGETRAAPARAVPALIFDFGAVLFDWQPAELLAHVLPDRAASPELAAHWRQQFFQGYEGDWGEFDAGLVEVADLVPRIARRTGLTEAEVRRVVDAVPPALQPLSATWALVRRLKAAGHRLYFLSNMPAPYADYLERVHAPLLGQFDGGVFSARVRLRKPQPAIFELALARFGLAPHEAFFIDDHPANIEAAQALGLAGHLFTQAQGLEAALLARGLLRADFSAA